MPRVISVKLRDEVAHETDGVLRTAKVSRNAYINDAIHFYNLLQQRRRLKRQLQRESQLVAADSLEVLEAFESLEDELPE